MTIRMSSSDYLGSVKSISGQKQFDKTTSGIKRAAYANEEKIIERGILSYLAIRRITSWKQNNGAFKIGNRFIKVFMDENGDCISGMPDIAGYMHNGIALYIEVKRKGGKLSKDQQAFLDNAKRCGAIAFVAQSIDDVERELKGLGYV